METDDYFAKMMFSSINNEVYFDNSDDYTGASEYGMGSIMSDKIYSSHRKTKQNLAICGSKSDHLKAEHLKSEHFSKSEHFVKLNLHNSGGNCVYDEVSLNPSHPPHSFVHYGSGNQTNSVSNPYNSSRSYSSPHYIRPHSTLGNLSSSTP